MYKILIADDEYWTRQKIKGMIDWEGYNLDFLEPAVDGEDVLKKIEENMPDILITDINMPFLDGVELLKILQQRYPQIITFVVSGYDDFEYVRSVFLSGAINYLVKPVTKIDLVQTISKALNILNDREKEALKDRKVNEDALFLASIIEDQEYSRLIEATNGNYMPTMSMNTGVELAGSSLMLIRLHELDKNEHNRNRLSMKIKKLIREAFGKDNVILFNHVYKPSEYIIISEQPTSKLSEYAETIKTLLAENMSAIATICISSHSYSMDSIYMAYVDTVGLLVTRPFKKESVIIKYDDHIKGTSGQSGNMSKETINRVKTYYQSHNSNGIKQVLWDEFDFEKEEDVVTFLDVKQKLRQICSTLNECINEANSTVDAQSMIDSMSDNMDSILSRLDSNLLRTNLEDLIDSISVEVEEESDDSIGSSVRAAVRYVEEHFFEDISLSGLAEQFGVEQSYFSRIFRKEAGENLISYITRLRVEKACDYMKNSDTNLSEISYMVGFEDYTYFSRIFKKVTGMSPRDYRQQEFKNLQL